MSRPKPVSYGRAVRVLEKLESQGNITRGSASHALAMMFHIESKDAYADLTRIAVQRMKIGSSRDFEVAIPKDFEELANTGYFRRKYGLETGSGSPYNTLRQKGLSDLEAQWKIFQRRYMREL